MQFKLGPMLLVCALCVGAQTAEDPAVARAKAGIEKLRSLVEAGALPRKELDKAEDQIADAEDAAYLRKTLYGSDLTDGQSEDMIIAADRRLARRTKALDEAQKLVTAGVASQLSLDTFRSELDLAVKERNLAETRAKLTHELAEMAKAEEVLAMHLAQQPSEAPKIAERFDGNGIFSTSTFSRVESAFEKRFGKTLPVSAMGETAVHRSLGFDHRGRIDVALFPDAPEGVWLRDYLTHNQIPYFAFRQAVPGKATGAHIHIGPMSTRLKLGG
jgi:hypothetical protein